MVALKGSKDAYRFVLDHVAPGDVGEEELANARHIVTNMIEIPIELAVQMNERRVAQSLYNHFYLCAWYDQQVGACRHHEDRPPFCHGFPFYGRDPLAPEMFGGLAAYPRCSYWHDIPREQWPAWVTEATVFANPQNVC